MQDNDYLAQEALKYLDIAQKFEQEGKNEDAIENYQLAADYLKKSGYMMHRISDLYERIEELKSFMRNQKLFQHEQLSAQIEKFQDQAFILIDKANNLESEGFFQDAIERYNSALKLLLQAGWSQTQIQNIKTKVSDLIEKQNLQKSIKSQKEIQLPTDVQSSPQIVDAFGEKIDVEKAEQLIKYREEKAKQERIQNDAFTFIDNAKFFERDNQFDKAIQNYEKAIELLISIGWAEQTQNLQFIVEKLRIEKQKYDSFKLQPQISEEDLSRRIYDESQVSINGTKIIEFDHKKRTEEEIQIEAFNLIDFAKKLDREKDYNKAIEKFQRAIQLFKSIGWDSYIQPIMNFIKDVKKKQKSEDSLENLKSKREVEIKKIQDSFYVKEREEIVQTAKEQEIRRKEYEQKRSKQIIKEKDFFTFLDKADDALQKKRDFDTALTEYQNALETLFDLGPSWESYIPMIKTTINSVKKLKEAQYKKEFETQKRLEDKQKEESKFQQQITDILQREREKLKQREFEIKLEQEKSEYFEHRRDSAFQALDDAQKYVKMGDLDKAIQKYQNVGNIFAEIQWNDELPLIEESIKELEQMKKESEIKRQEGMQNEIERQKEEQAFQEKISIQLRLEQERLRKREVKLREKEKELEYRQKRKEDAFKLLDEAQNLINQADFDKAIELYHDITNIFAEIQWYDEVEFIGNAIIEIENKRREYFLKRQGELQEKLEREREERDFQINITEKLKSQKEKFKERSLKLREKEKELEYREDKRRDAFRLIEEAQNFLSLGKFNEAIETYRKVANLFAQIQWREEIPIINNAILEIETIRKKKDIIDQKHMEDVIRKEMDNREFAERIRLQREIEGKRLTTDQELIAKKKKLSAQNLSKQEEAFKLLDKADDILKREEFNDVLGIYQQALNILENIGWTGGYIKLIKETINELKIRNEEKQRRELKEKELSRKQIESEKKFEMQIKESMEKEKARLKVKKIEIKKKEELIRQMESLKIEAFNLMDKAENLMNQGLYEQAIELYHQAELVLNELQYPTDSIKELILDIQEKKREKELAKQYEMEQQIKKQEEQKIFQQKITENMKYETDRIRKKEIGLIKQARAKEYIEKRREDAFDLLEQAEILMKKSQYNKAVEFYHSAELIFNEIQFPTDSLKELIIKVREKKREQELEKQKQLEYEIQRERAKQKYDTKLVEQISKEKEKLKRKEIKIQKLEEIRIKAEINKEKAFKILDEAERFTKNKDYEKAINSYRKAMLILNEIQYPTEPISQTIVKVEELKKKKSEEEQLNLKKQLEKMEEEKRLISLIEERRKYEREKELAQKLAIEEKERLVQEQLSNRETAYNLLEKGGTYLKRNQPDYDRAISLYVQARDILAEKVGWEPEINNLDILIGDLGKERKHSMERKELETQIQIQRQKEYDRFQEEIRNRREEYLRKKKEQQSKMRQLSQRREQIDQIKQDALELIDEGKRLAVHHDFEGAYLNFEKALTKFNEIGWTEQAKFIKREIENTKLLQENVKQDELRIQEIYEDLTSKKQLEELRLLEEEKRIQQTVGKVSDMTNEVSQLIKEQDKEIKTKLKKEKVLLKKEAKSFSKDMANLLKLKQELIEEINRSKEKSAKEREDLQKAKDKERANEIKKMLKDVSKKEKN
ncbi:MAG: hypothetical protein ACFFBH_14410 [Promethearchaeota archaeon]